VNSLEKKLIAAISAVVLLLVAVGIVAFKALNDSIEVNQQVSNTRETLTEVESTLLTLKDAETDQRSYIAGRNDAIEHFHLTKEETRRKLERLRGLTAHNSRHQERLAKLEPAIRKKLERMTETLSRKREAASTAKETEISEEESREMDNIGQLLSEIRSEEQDNLQNHIASSEKSIRNVSISFGGLFFLIVFLLFLVFFLVRRDLVIQKQLHERLLELASLDELTTLYNRRELNRCFKDEQERFRRFGQPFSLLLLDIDHFKAVNDKYGHQIGDRVLKDVANKIRDGIRSIDVPGRFGGEEFAVILPNTKAEGAYVIAERLRQKIAEEPFKFERADETTVEVQVTISIGVSSIEKDETEDDVIRTADAALYQAKNEGRDRTVMFEQIGTLQ
jgi:diguanylate cyclase (GGDEF)-like protein